MRKINACILVYNQYLFMVFGMRFFFCLSVFRQQDATNAEAEEEEEEEPVEESYMGSVFRSLGMAD